MQTLIKLLFNRVPSWMVYIAILFALLDFSAFAQTSTNTPPIPTGPFDFAQQVGSWLTSVNTNETWANTPFSLWTAADFQSGAQVSAEVGASYDLWHLSTNFVFAPEATIRNASIGGVVVSTMGGFNLSYEHYDLKLGGYIEGGYSEQNSTGLIEIGARATKKLTTSTFTFIGVYWDIPLKGKMQDVPSATAGLGWTF